RQRVNHWQIPAKEFDALEDGLKRTYGRARKAMGNAYDNPTMENFHEWRKRVKYHRYHAFLLKRAWKPVIGEHYTQTKDLSDYLGDIHDLDILKRLATEEPDFRDLPCTPMLLELIDRRQANLRGQCRKLGSLLFQEESGALADRFAGYWRTWRERKRSKTS
ncbi:CHAD domain-containing protein, partial [bacterium]|nr:CHAD domain-containing protein [bacterium]